MERQAGSQAAALEIGDQKWTNEIKAALDERDSTIATQLGKVEQENADLRRCLEEVRQGFPPRPHHRCPRDQGAT